MTTVTALILWMILSPDFIVQTSGDIYCAGTIQEPCISYLNITYTPQNPLYKTFYLYSKDKVKLGFSPDIKLYALCKKDGRYKKARSEENICGPGYREILTSPYYYEYTYLYKFYAKQKEEWMLIGLKNNPGDRVKWGIDVVNAKVDPVWDAEYAKIICKNVTTAYDKVVTLERDALKNVSCDPKKETCKFQYINKSWYNKIPIREKYEDVIKAYSTECKPTGAVEYMGVVYNYDDFYCMPVDGKLVCYSCLDGRCQYGTGECKSGETCLTVYPNSTKKFDNSLKTNLKDKIETISVK